MRVTSDEMLMAFADNALDQGQRAEIAQRLAEDPALAARLEAFVITGKPLARVFDTVIDEPIPARLLAVFDAARAAPSATVHDFKPRQAAVAARRFGGSNWQRMAAAAVFGLGVGWAAHAGFSPSGGSMIALENGQMVADSTLKRALENSASGQKIAAGGGSVAVVFSFTAKDGGVCRQYHIDGAANRAMAGVACRDAGGSWPVIVQAEAKPRLGGDKIAPAGEKHAVIDPLVDRLIATDVMGADEEADALRKKWRVQP